MDQFIALIPKLTVSIGLLYFLVNPLLRHQNTIKGVDAIFLFIAILIFWLNDEETNYTLLAILMGVLAVLYLITKVILHRQKLDIIFLLNVNRKDYPEVHQRLFEQADSLKISPKMVHFLPKLPFVVVLKTDNQKAVSSLMKDLEKWIREKIKIHFWFVYGSVLLSLVILAILWRF